MGHMLFSSDGVTFNSFGGEIKETNLIEVEPIEDVKEIAMGPAEGTFEVEFRINKFLLYELFTGIKLTNNYLKMHGGVIQRHRTIDRYLRKHKR